MSFSRRRRERKLRQVARLLVALDGAAAERRRFAPRRSGVTLSVR